MRGPCGSRLRCVPLRARGSTPRDITAQETKRFFPAKTSSPGLFMGEPAKSRLTQLHEGTPGLAWWRDRAVRHTPGQSGNFSCPLFHGPGAPAGHTTPASRTFFPGFPWERSRLKSTVTRSRLSSKQDPRWDFFTAWPPWLGNGWPKWPKWPFL